MHVGISFWEILFALFLFTLLISKLFSLTKNHIIPYLEKQLRATKKEQTELLDKEKLVTSTLNKVDNQRKQQEKMFVLLEKKVQIWHKEWSQKIQQKQRNVRDNAEKITKKRIMQEKNFIAAKIMQEALPAIISNAQQELIHSHVQDKIMIRSCFERLNVLIKQGAQNG